MFDETNEIILVGVFLVFVIFVSYGFNLTNTRLFRFSVSFWVSYVNCIFSRNLYFSLKLQTLIILGQQVTLMLKLMIVHNLILCIIKV